MKAKFLFLTIMAFVFNFATAQLGTTGDLSAKATSCGDLDALFTHSGQSLHNLMYSEVKLNALSSNKSSPGLNGFSSKMSSLTTKGSPYLVDNFEKGDVYNNDKLLGTLYARYNAFSQEIEIKRTNLAEEQYKALIKDERIKVVFADKTIEYNGFIDNKGNRQDEYLISVTAGTKYKMYQRFKVNFIEGKEAENSMVADTPNRFSSTTEYYLKDVETNLVSYLPTKKSKFIDLFNNDDKAEVAAIIKKNRLNLKNENDLKQIFDLVNTVSEEKYAAAQE